MGTTTVMRRVATRVGLWAVTLFGGFWLTIFVIVAVDADEGSTRLGAIVLAVPSAAVLAAGIYGLRRTPKVPVLAERTPPAALQQAHERLRTREPIVLHPSRRRWTVMLVSFAAAAGICVYALVDSSSAGFVGALAFTGAMALLSIAHLIPSLAYPRIAPDALVARSALHTSRSAWNDVERFKAYEIQNRYSSTKHVGFDRRDLTPERQSFWQTLNRGVSGVDAGLPDTYGFDHHDLADLLNEARREYATAHGVSASERAERALMAPPRACARTGSRPRPRSSPRPAWRCSSSRSPTTGRSRPPTSWLPPAARRATRSPTAAGRRCSAAICCTPTRST